MGSYSLFFILSVFYCFSYLLFLVFYLLKVNLRIPIVFLCILGIYVHIMSHSGGPDYPIYRLFYEGILNKEWSDVFNFLGTELWIYPFLFFFRLLNLDFRWALFFSALLLYLMLKFFSLLSKRNSSYYFSWCLATILASPMAPYLFGNVIRQGLASIVIVYFMSTYINGTVGFGLRYIPAFLLTHRAALVFSLITFYLGSSWLYRYFIGALCALAVGLFIYYFGDSLISLLSFYKSFDDKGVIGSTSLIRSFLRLVLISIPLLIFMTLTKKNEKGNLRFIALFMMVMIFLYLVAAKLGDRFMYFMPALIYPFIFSSKSRVIISVCTFFVVFPSLILISIGYYENIFL